MDGSVTMENTPGGWLTVVLSLPAALPEATHPVSAPPAPAAPASALPGSP
jgi:hypothetical protein